PSGKYNLQFGYRMSVYVDDTQITNSDYAPFDGKVHKVRLELLRAASLNYLGARKDVTGCYNGIFANPAATINGSTQKFTLGNSYTQGDTEISKDDDNSITRVLVPDANIEQYQLSSDKTQWDNISPSPQELSATIEIA
ncbi:MAG: hypothetical protein GY830_04370, partial [Bacteroidetes bacterium]|nr:hypothetical protein [Bacteroidota bacterium]